MDLYENSIFPFAVVFFESLSTFDDFYLKKESWVNNVIWDDLNFFQKMKDKITESIPDFRFYYRYITFKKTGFPDYDFTSSIKVKLNHSSYDVIAEDGKKIRKLYGELISEKESNMFIRNEKERHKNFLQSLIQEKKRNDSKK